MVPRPKNKPLARRDRGRGDTGRGVRAAARSLRTLRKLAVLAAALIAAASAAAWKAAHMTTIYQWYAVSMLILSRPSPT